MDSPSRLLPNIAFMGKMGAGKTTAAEFLSGGYGYSHISFASELKKIAVALWGPDAMTDRTKLQQLGMKLREIDPMVWVTVARRKIEGEMAKGFPVTVDDLRFPNEYHVLRKLGFVIVQVCAHEGQRINRLTANGKLQDRSQMEDVSETALDGAVADYTVLNTTTPHEFENAVSDVIEREALRRG